MHFRLALFKNLNGFRNALLTITPDAYLTDPQYPIDLSRRSSKNEDGSLPVRKESCRQTGKLHSFWPKTSSSLQKCALTTKSAIDNRIYIAFAHCTFQHVGLPLNPAHNTKFSI